MLVPGLQLFGTALCALRLLSTRTTPVMVSVIYLCTVYKNCLFLLCHERVKLHGLLTGCCSFRVLPLEHKEGLKL